MSTRKKVLMIIHLPPPMHGTTLVNTYVAESTRLREQFDIRVVPIRFARHVGV